MNFCCAELTEHGVELLWVEVPLPPRRLVTFRLGVVGVVELGFRAERVQHSQHTPAKDDTRLSSVGRPGVVSGGEQAFKRRKAEPNRLTQYIHPIIYTRVQENKVILILF